MAKREGKPGYAAHKRRSAAQQAKQSREGRDIGPPHPVHDPDRRARCERDFGAFCREYLPQTFLLPFSADHLKVISRIEDAVLRGGLFALAMPRASGKSSLVEAAATWAVLYGHRRYVVLIACDQDTACQRLESIKLDLETNDQLGGEEGDFDAACHPIRALGRISNRSKGQLWDGVPTYLTWSSDVLVLPTLDGAPSSGAVIQAVGLTSSIRGMKRKDVSGRSIRPDLVIPDDPQTDDSARSASQCAYRERLLAGAVLGLAGPGKKIAGIMPCTVIAPGDVADNLLDRRKHPEWAGERTKTIYSWPKRLDLWEQYAMLRAESLRAEKGGAEATEFYRANRAAMDEGAVVAWAERFDPDELSALQSAYNLYLRDPIVFQAEYQNDPQPITTGDLVELTPDEIMDRLSRLPRGTAPGGATHITAFVDVQQTLLFWCVCAWDDQFGGSVLDYGAWPDQRRASFTLRDARPTLAEATRVSSIEGSVYAGLDALVHDLAGRQWPTDAGGVLRLERCVIDANWGLSTDVVYRFCRQSAHASIATPSHGKAIGPSGRPIAEWDKRPGERRGLNWIQPPAKAGRVRHLIYDVNFWKSFVHARLAMPRGERGGLLLFGERALAHKLFAEHLAAEYRVRTHGRGRDVDEWKLKPARPDNHWLDCLVGCAVAASMGGAAPGGMPAPTKPSGPRLSWKEMQQQQQERQRRDRR